MASVISIPPLPYPQIPPFPPFPQFPVASFLPSQTAISQQQIERLRALFLKDVQNAAAAFDETSPAKAFGPCGFCAGDTDNDPRPKRTWRVCNRMTCRQAADAQDERIYAGLVDCPETRAAALSWVQRDNK